jgi:hypothetical protein
MSNVIINEVGKFWNGSSFGGEPKELAVMDQLNEEMGKVLSTGYHGKISVVQKGAVRTENPLMEVDI